MVLQKKSIKLTNLSSKIDNNKNKKTPITSIMNEIGQITTFPVVIKKIREYDKKLYGPKFGNLEKIDQFLKN